MIKSFTMVKRDLLCEIRPNCGLFHQLGPHADQVPQVIRFILGKIPSFGISQGAIKRTNCTSNKTACALLVRNYFPFSISQQAVKGVNIANNQYLLRPFTRGNTFYKTFYEGQYTIIPNTFLFSHKMHFFILMGQ